MARKIVGLDIGTTAVRAAELSVRRGRVVLDRLGQTGLPQGAVVDGEVTDPAAVTAAIKALWRHARIGSRHVIVGVANQRVVVRLVDLPWMQHQELQRSLAYQAGDYLPIPVDEAELDYHVVGEYENAGGSACCGCCWPPRKRRCSPAPAGGDRRGPAAGRDRPEPDRAAALARAARRPGRGR